MVERNYRGRKSEMCSNKDCPSRKKTTKKTAKPGTGKVKKAASGKEAAGEDQE
jgi:hypothetical protein